MANRIFLDTNIVADIIDKSRYGHKKALELLEHLRLEDYTICRSEDMLTTLFYISKDKTNTLLFFENLIFIDWVVLTFGLDIIKRATSLALTQRLDLEDVLQCFCAKENSCNVVITNDKEFYQCGIDIVNINDFLKFHNR